MSNYPSKVRCSSCCGFIGCSYGVMPRHLKNAGWVQINGKWFCDECEVYEKKK